MNNKQNKTLSRIQSFLKNDLWNLEPTSLSKARRAGLKFMRISMLVVKGFREDKCTLHASALTFISVMALVPFLVILFAIAKGLGFQKASTLLMERTADMPGAFQQAVTNIITIVDSASAGTLGSIGTALFLWVAIKMLSNIEETFNLVWGVKIPRSLIDKIRNYIFIMVAAPILLIAAGASQPILMGFANYFQWMGPLLKIGLRAIPVLCMAIAFDVVYLFLPNTKVKFTPATIGALIAAILFVIFQYAMIELGVGVSKYNQIYGALAAIPIFLFWVQMSWMILLMGAEVSFSVQNSSTYAREYLSVNPSTRARLCLAIVLMKKIYDCFKSNNGAFDTIGYSSESHIPVRLINDVISILANAGLIVETSNRPDCYTLLRDPINISALNIIDTILDDGTDPDALGLTNAFLLFSEITDESFHNLEKKVLKTI